MEVQKFSAKTWKWKIGTSLWLQGLDIQYFAAIVCKNIGVDMFSNISLTV